MYRLRTSSGHLNLLEMLFISSKTSRSFDRADGLSNGYEYQSVNAARQTRWACIID